GPAWTGAPATFFISNPAIRAVRFVPPAPPPQLFDVTVTTIGSGTGSVTRNPPAGPYAGCSNVTLTATADPGSCFVAWNGDVPGAPNTTNPLAVLVDSNETITARFNNASQGILQFVCDGMGSIHADPPNQDFTSPGGPYSITQPIGTVVT